MSDPIDPALPDDATLLDRVIARQATPAELARLTASDLRALETLRQALGAPTASRVDDESDRATADLWRFIRTEQGRRRRAARPLALVPSTAPEDKRLGRYERTTRTVLRGWRSIPIAARAAAIVAIIGGGVLLTHLPPGARRIGTSAAPQVVTTHRGERTNVRLPDGTRVVLGPASRLSYSPQLFGKPRRDVDLVGQAAFDVIYDGVRPFAVRVGPLTAEDLGTRFSVRGYAGSPTRVAVAEGSVAVRRSDHAEPGVRARAVAGAPPAAAEQFPPTLLVNGSAAMFAAADGTLLGIGMADSAVDFGWTTGALLFRNTPLSTIAEELSRVYDVNLTIVGDSLRTARADVGFHTETAEQACATLALLAHARCHASGRVLTVGPR